MFQIALIRRAQRPNSPAVTLTILSMLVPRPLPGIRVKNASPVNPCFLTFVPVIRPLSQVHTAKSWT